MFVVFAYFLPVSVLITVWFHLCSARSGQRTTSTQPSCYHFCCLWDSSRLCIGTKQIQQSTSMMHYVKGSNDYFILDCLFACNERVREHVNRVSSRVYERVLYVMPCVCTWNFRWGVGHETSEKQAPSALELMGQFKKAMAQLRVSTGKTHPTPTALNMCIAEFNKLVQRKYKVDGPKRKVILSLLRVPEEFVDLLSGHYDKFKHSTSGVPRSACMYQEEVLPESYP